MQELREMDPRQLGPYWLAGRLGEGGQGVVYEAYDDFGTRVAVKALHADGDFAVEEELRREVRMLERVAPFCTAKVLAADLDHVPPYVVSQYIPGPTLQRMVTAQGVYEAEALTRLAIGMATALAAIHAAGVVHRDLKPENVLIGPDGPRVIDFGIARAPDLTRSATGVIKGTPRWMAPETLNANHPTPAVDVWAWAAILLFAATGIPPFGGTGTDVLQIAYSVHTVEPDLDVLPERLRPLVARALDRNPAGRPTAAELLTGLIGADADTGPDTGRADPTVQLRAGSAEEGGPLAAGQRAAASLAAATVPLPLGEVAELAYAALPVHQQTLVPRLLLRLVAAAPDARSSLRAAARSEFEDGDTPAEDVRVVVDTLLHAGVLVQDAGTGQVTLASAALVRAWARLREWVDEERDALETSHELADAARRWHGQGRRDGDVLHGSALEQAVSGALTRRRHLALNTTEKDFLAASLSADRRRSRRKRQVLAAVCALVLCTGAAGSYALQQSRDAAAQHREAELQSQKATLERQNAQRLAAVNDAANLAADAQSVRDHDPVLAAQLAVAAYRAAPIPAATSQLFASLGSQLNAVVGNAGSPVTRMTAQADGPLVATSDDTNLRIWNLAARNNPAAEAVLAHTSAMAFVPHSTKLIASCATPQHGMCVWDLTDPKKPSVIGNLSYPPGGKRNMPTSVAVSPTGALVATAGLEGDVVIFSLAHPEHPAVLTTLPNPSTRHNNGDLAGVAFASHGDLLAATILGGHTTVWNTTRPAAPQKVATLPTGYQTIAFSPDGSLMAAVGDQNAGLWKMTTPSRPSSVDASLDSCPKDFLHQDMNAVVFRPDGTELDYGSSGAQNSTGELCRVHLDTGGDSGYQMQPGGSQLPSGVDFLTMAYTPDGRLLSGGNDGVVRAWPTAPDEIHGLEITGNTFFALSPDTRLLAAPERDNTVNSNSPLTPIGIYDITAQGGPRLQGTFTPTALVQDITFLNATTLLTVQQNGAVQLWDLTDPQHPVKGSGLGTAAQHASGVFAHYNTYVGGDKAGDLASVLGDDGRVHLWRVSVGAHATEVGSFPFTKTKVTTFTVVLPDGRTALSATSTGIDWWDVHDPAHPVKGGTTPIDLSNDLGYAVVNGTSAEDLAMIEPAGDSSGAPLHLVAVRDGKVLTEVTPKAPAGSQLALSDDNRLLASTGTTGDTITLWDVHDPAQPRAVSQVPTLPRVSSIDINHGATMMAVTDGTSIQLWNVADPAHPAHVATVTPPQQSATGISSANFTPDGRRVVVQFDNSVLLFGTDPSALAAQLCLATGNTVTAAQWGTYAPETPYRKPCP